MSLSDFQAHRSYYIVWLSIAIFNFVSYSEEFCLSQPHILRHYLLFYIQRAPEALVKTDLATLSITSSFSLKTQCTLGIGLPGEGEES